MSNRRLSNIKGKTTQTILVAPIDPKYFVQEPAKFFKLLFFLSFFAVTVLLSGCNLFDNKMQGYVGDSDVPPKRRNPLKNRVAMSATLPEILIVKGSSTRAIIQLSKSLVNSETLTWSIEKAGDHFLESSGSINLESGRDKFELFLAAKNNGIYEGETYYNLKVQVNPDIFVSDLIIPVKVQEIVPKPVVSFFKPAYTISESDSSSSVEVRLSQASSHIIKVEYKLAGSAVRGTNYTVSPEALFFDPGEKSKFIDVYPIHDGAITGMLDVSLQLDRVSIGTANIDTSNQVSSVLILDMDNPSGFSITGVTGGTDVIADGYLTNGNIATVKWAAATGSIGYEITIFQDNGLTIKCPTQAVGAGVLTSTFTGCTLDENQTYKISVIAVYPDYKLLSATNSNKPFTVKTLPPGSFSIIGMMGGLDIIPDNYVSGSLTPTIVWLDSSGEGSYVVEITNLGGGTVCGPTSVPANTTSYTFEGCNLIQSTQYFGKVKAVDNSGFLIQTADNNTFLFLVTSTLSGYLITGITGGVGDFTVDAFMDDGEDPVVHWQAALNAQSYEVYILNSDNSPNCSVTTGITGGMTSVSVPGCNFVLHNNYKIRVNSTDFNGVTSTAANYPLSFKYRVGLYIDGTGGSYYHGLTITSCGGPTNDRCDATTPYVLSGEYYEKKIRVTNNGVISALPWIGETPAAGNGILKLSADFLNLDAGGAIHMDGRGYTAGLGPGAGYPGYKGSSGGAHAGLTGLLSGKGQRPAYGNPIVPNDMGSGGGSTEYGGSAIGGAGGGIVIVDVFNTLTFGTGSIRSNGAQGALFEWGCTNNCSGVYGGSGAGGSVQLHADQIVGLGGTIQALGAPGLSAYGNGNSGFSDSGGGGRIAVYYRTNTHTGSLNYGVYGGNSSFPAASGTVFYKDTDDLVNTNGFLFADNNNIPYIQGVETPLTSNLVFDDISTRNLATFIIPSTDTYQHFSDTINFRLVIAGILTLKDSLTNWIIGPLAYVEWRRIDDLDDWHTITIQAGAVLSHSMNYDTPKYKIKIITTNLNVAGSIDVSARGYAATKGLGTPSSSGDGASYGGQGGYVNGSKRPPYGDLRDPEYMGSGGWANSWETSYGGGWIDIKANTLTFSNLGSLLANGQNFRGPSGGTIKMDVDSVLGSGALISAKGGAGTGTNSGGGSGGRVALYYNEPLSYSGGYAALASSILINGGLGGVGGLVTGSSDGAGGTIYTRDKLNLTSNGILIVKNSPNTYNEFASTPLMNEAPFDSIITDSVGTILIPVGFNFTAPSSTIDYRIISEGTFIIPAGGTDLTIASGGYFEYRNAIPLTFGVLNIQNGGVLSHTRNFNVRQYLLDITAATLNLSGAINVNGKGFGPNSGPGISAEPKIGAGYGGFGGTVGETTLNLTTSYGQDKVKNPDDLGSGSPDYGGPGTYGGGIIKLRVTGSMALDGSLLANGDAGHCEPNWCGSGSSGGSGGSIYVNATGATITGTTATISANGGAGIVDSGNGAGGRISIVCTTDSFVSGLSSLIDSGNLRAYGGTTNVTWGAGAAGTIFLQRTPAETNGRLYVNNGPNSRIQFVETPIPDGLSFDSITTANNGALIVTSSQNFILQPASSSTLNYNLVVAGGFQTLANNLTVASGGILEWRKSMALDLDSLTIANGGLLTHSSNVSSQLYQVNVKANNITVAQGGIISADGRGYAIKNGPGGGTGGAAYGGNTNSFRAYGSVKTPADIGSGGTNGAGGGFIQLLTNALGTLSLSGQITAKGANTSNGAGSGGSIFIDADILAGVNTTAEINANGGSSTNVGTESGSGGRIAIKYNTDSYTGSIANLMAVTKSQGGASNVHGSAGTIYYIEKDAEANGHLVIKNPGHNYPNENTSTSLPNNEIFDSMTVDSGAVVEVKTGDTFTLPSSTVNYYLIIGGDVLLPASSPTTLTVTSPGVLEFRRGTTVTSFPNIDLQVGARMTHSYNSYTKTYWIDLDTVNLTLNGNIDVSGRGFASDSGPGFGYSAYHPNSNPPPSTYIAGGGSHAGLGNPGEVGTSKGYNSIKWPSNLGSGGGHSKESATIYYGGSGGGLVQLKASNSLVLNGNILANGNSGSLSGAHKAGAGAGGSVRIVTKDFSGAGSSIQVRGGDGPGGNGGGGRVSIAVSGVDTYGGGGLPLGITLDARGGTSTTYTAGGGTYFYKHAADAQGHLILDNKTMPYTFGIETELIQTDGFDSISVLTETTGVAIRKGATITFSSSNLNFPLIMSGEAFFPSDDLTVKSTGKLYFGTDSFLVLRDLTLESGSFVSHLFNNNRQQYAVNIQARNINMQSTALMDVSSLGYGSQQGLGRGQTLGTDAGGGASHGGLGGGSPAPGVNSPGIVYGDSSLNPVTIGSGGGTGSISACSGGKGGGAIHLKVASVLGIGGNFTFNGSIKANAGDGIGGACSSGGGGSGGGIFIEAENILGTTGIIEAKGGAAPLGSSNGGGGGGGRVNINASTNVYAPTHSNISILGGTAEPDRVGSAGSLVTTP